MDIELKGLQDEFSNSKSNQSDTASKKEEMQVSITNEVEIIRKELYTKLNGMLVC